MELPFLALNGCRIIRLSSCAIITSFCSWLVGSFKKKHPEIATLQATGRCGLPRILEKLKDDAIQFGAFRVFAVDSDGSKRSKFVYFLWQGPSAGVMTRTKASNHKGAWRSFFDIATIGLELTAADQLKEDDVSSRLDSTAGSHKPAGYEFGTGNPDDLEVAEEKARLEAEAEQKRIEDEERARAEAEAAAEAAAAEEARRKRREARSLAIKRTKHKSKRFDRPSEVSGYDFSELSKAGKLEHLLDPDEKLSWLVLRVDGKAKKVSVAAEGSGELDETAAAMDDGAVQYACIGVNAVDRSGDRAALRTRLVLLEFVGGDVPTKARFAAQEARGAVEKYCGDAHLVVRASGRAELEEKMTSESMSAGLARHSGSHQAGVAWRFGHYDVLRQAEDAKEHQATGTMAGATAGGAAAGGSGEGAAEAAADPSAAEATGDGAEGEVAEGEEAGEEAGEEEEE